MAKKADRIIIDTNLWISFLITKNFKKLDEKIRKGSIRICFSLEAIDEFLTVADRPKFRKYFSRADVEQLINLFDVYGQVVEVKSKVGLCRDKKDNFLLSLSRDSHANYLITGDKDLLDMGTFEVTKIIKMTDYLKKIE